MQRSSLNGDGKNHGANRLPTPSQNLNQHEEKIIADISMRHEEIESLWKKAEDDLKRFRVPQTVSHYLYTVNDAYPVDEFTLEWRRHGKAWRICYCVTTSWPADGERPDEQDVTPITDCSYELRLGMVEHFVALRKKVIEEAQKTIHELDGAISDFRRLLNG